MDTNFSVNKPSQNFITEPSSPAKSPTDQKIKKVMSGLSTPEIHRSSSDRSSSLSNRSSLGQRSPISLKEMNEKTRRLSASIDLTTTGAIHCLKNGGRFIGAVSPEGSPNSEGYLITPDGDEVWGTFHNGRAEGSVSCKLYNGCTYKGSFENECPHGMGRMYDKDNTLVYEGNFNMGRKEGWGMEILSTGETYRGEFKNGLREGKGTLVSKDELTTISGDFRAGKIHGSGEMVKKDKSTTNIWRGEFSKGIMQGEGEHVVTDKTGKVQTSLKGTFVNGVFDFSQPYTAKINLDNGDHYEGGMLQKKPHGHGTLSRKNGDVITGEFVQGKPDPQKPQHGILHYTNGIIYQGGLSSRMGHPIPFGQGVMNALRPKAQFVGVFNDHKLIGEMKGEKTWFKGEFENQTPKNGEGNIWLRDEINCIGTFKDGKLTGKGVIINHKTGEVYTGETKDGLPHGEGKRVLPDGTLESGRFERGVCVEKREDSYSGKTVHEEDEETHMQALSDSQRTSFDSDTILRADGQEEEEPPRT